MAWERIEDPVVADQLAGLFRKPGDDGAVTLSGRCGECGYLLGSPGHEITCGKPLRNSSKEA